ncbi:MAG: peptidoglycan DD-metalloendopeptidase family protein [SAR324 cluster bacterium]|nr:peptidoglycan DD-metalloendopeptidase family protein [SAR324 cluster bacterium]
MILLIGFFTVFPLSEARPEVKPSKIDRLIRLRESEKQRLKNEQQETLAQINITENRSLKVLELVNVFGKNIERTQIKLDRLKHRIFILKKQIIKTESKINILEIEIEKDKEEINRQLLVLFYVGRVKNMTLFVGLSSFDHYFRNQKLLQTSTLLDIELLNRLNLNHGQLQEEKDKLNNQRIDLTNIQLEAEAEKKLLKFERLQQVTYLKHLRTDRTAHVRYLREIQVGMEQLNDKLYSLTVTKENQNRIRYFTGFYKKKNSLPSPVTGNVVHYFNQKESPFFTLFNKGVVVETTADEPVHSILSGKVGYAGPFKGYQNLVILDHGKGSFSVYGNLGELFVLKDDIIDQGDILGSVAYDEVEERSLFYFEMRFNKKAVNPTRWLKKPRWKK